jgi:hypothetical protein
VIHQRKKELDTVIRNMANGKAPGKSKIPAEPLKALSDDTKETLLEILIKCYKGELNPDKWHTAIL